MRIRTPWIVALLLTVACQESAATDAGTGRSAGRWETGVQASSEGARRYWLWVPAGYTPDKPLPLLTALHGCGQSVADLAGVTRFNQIADEESFFVLYPEQAAEVSLKSCWNWFDARNQQRGTGETSLIAGMVGDVKNHYRVDAQRVYVTGASSGGVTTSSLLACYPDLFAAGAIVAGGMFKAATGVVPASTTMQIGSLVPPDVAGKAAWECSDFRSGIRPFIVMHGTEDHTVHPINGVQAMLQFLYTNDWRDDGVANDSISARNLVATREWVPGGHFYTVNSLSVGGRVVAQHYAIEGMDHTWSGGSPLFPYADPKGPDASRLLWEFFKQQRNPDAH